MTTFDVCVVGSLVMDLVVRAPRRPLPGETVLGSEFEMFLGGKGFNQAVAAARAGARTAMVGRLGADDFGERFTRALAEDGIDAGNVVVDASSGTGVGVPLVEDSGENSIVVVPRANGRVLVGDVERAAPTITASRVLLLQLELPIESAVAAARLAHEAGVTVILNPAPAVDGLEPFEGIVDVLVPNESEAERLVGRAGSPAELAGVLRASTGADVVITLGGAGALVLDAAGTAALPAHDVPVVDTVGAGDAFCGALGAWLAEGASLREAAVVANRAGSLAVTRRGAEPSMPRRAELEAAAATGAPTTG